MRSTAEAALPAAAYHLRPTGGYGSLSGSKKSSTLLPGAASSRKNGEDLPEAAAKVHLFAAGKGGKGSHGSFIHDLRGLRGEMRQQLAQFLRKSGKVKFKFWLEVKTPQPQKFMILGSQSGEVEATLRARLPVEQLQQALESLDRGQWRQRKRQGSTSWMSPRKVSKSSGGALRKRRL